MVRISRNTDVLPVTQNKLLLSSGSLLRIVCTASRTICASSSRALAGFCTAPQIT